MPTLYRIFGDAPIKLENCATASCAGYRRTHRASCSFRLCIALFALSRSALASQAVFGSFYLALKAFNATVMIGGTVNFRLAIAGLAAWRCGSFYEVGIICVVLFLCLALFSYFGPQVDETFTVVFYAHGVILLSLRNR